MEPIKYIDITFSEQFILTGDDTSYEKGLHQTYLEHEPFYRESLQNHLDHNPDRFPELYNLPDFKELNKEEFLRFLYDYEVHFTICKHIRVDIDYLNYCTPGTYVDVSLMYLHKAEEAIEFDLRGDLGRIQVSANSFNRIVEMFYNSIKTDGARFCILRRSILPNRMILHLGASGDDAIQTEELL